ncbi:MAG: NAD(P)/FAD-dependent oxidoreductase [Candidatus Omnitrophota bacterium]
MTAQDHCRSSAQNRAADYDVIVVGAGAAGMMAAIRAAQIGARVLLLEKGPRLGRKVRITGKGRCNVTNACAREEFIKRFFHNGDFLRDAFKAFSNRDLMHFFEQQGVALKVERQQRVFPQSGRAADVAAALETALAKNSVEVRTNIAVRDVLVDGRVRGVVLDGGEHIFASAVMIATGGLSYPETGSTGDGLLMARKSGHRITPTGPALTSLETRQKYVKEWEGLTLKNIRLIFVHGRKRQESGMGELLFTARGVSGPLVVSASGQAGEWLERGQAVRLEIDLKPALSADDLDARVLRDIDAAPRQRMKNFCRGLLPQRMIARFLKEAGVDTDLPANQLTAHQRRNVICKLKGLSFDIKSVAPLKTAMVTRGGISVRDVDPRTMQSRRVPGLYFAGEVLDVDGDTGGFNLQAAFSTGFLAGQSAVG